LPPKSNELPPREIVEELSYTSQLAALKIPYRAIDIAFERVSMAVSRRPEIFPEVEDTGIHRLRINGYSRFPDLDVWFAFDSKRVHLHYVELAPDEE
jgi:hypothetical protein